MSESPCFILFRDKTSSLPYFESLVTSPAEVPKPFEAPWLKEVVLSSLRYGSDWAFCGLLSEFPLSTASQLPKFIQGNSFGTQGHTFPLLTGISSYFSQGSASAEGFLSSRTWIDEPVFWHQFLTDLNQHSSSFLLGSLTTSGRRGDHWSLV